MRLDGEIPCPGCGGKTKVKGFKAPQKLFPTLITFKCSLCESEVMAKLFVAKGQSDRTKVQIASSIRRASQALIDLKREEAEWNAMSAADVDEKIASEQAEAGQG